MELESYSQILSSKSPVPGGGSAASYVGALSSSLLMMVCNLTIGKKRYEEYDEELENIISTLEEKRLGLLECMKEDEEMFSLLSVSYKTKENIEECLLKALEPPYRTIRLLSDVVSHLDRLSVIGSRLALSDVSCSAALALGSLLASKANVKVNTRLLEDKEKANSINREVDELVDKCSDICMRIYNRIDEELSNG